MINCAPVLQIMALSLSVLPATQSVDCALDLSTARPELVDFAPALSLSKGDSPGRRAQLVSGLRLRSVALIHTCRPSGPRTRPHHSPRSRTQ